MLVFRSVIGIIPLSKRFVSNSFGKKTYLQKNLPSFRQHRGTATVFRAPLQVTCTSSIFRDQQRWRFWTGSWFTQWEANRRFFGFLLWFCLDTKNPPKAVVRKYTQVQVIHNDVSSTVSLYLFRYRTNSEFSRNPRRIDESIQECSRSTVG